MRHVLPDWVTELLSVVAPNISKRATSYHADRSCHVMGSPFYHPTLDRMAMVVRECERQPIHIDAVSGGYRQSKMRYTTRYRYVNKAPRYRIYMLDNYRHVIEYSEYVSNLLTIRREFLELKRYWLANANTTL